MIFRTTPEASWQSLAKQCIDFFGALILLLLVLLVAVSSHRHRHQTDLARPGLFQTKRSGMNGEPFTLYKFRTMVTTPNNSNMSSPR